MLQQFIELNRSIQKTGKFQVQPLHPTMIYADDHTGNPMQYIYCRCCLQENDAFLYQLIASNNIVVTTVLSKVMNDCCININTSACDVNMARLNNSDRYSAAVNHAIDMIHLVGNIRRKRCCMGQPRLSFHLGESEKRL